MDQVSRLSISDRLDSPPESEHPHASDRVEIFCATRVIMAVDIKQLITDYYLEKFHPRIWRWEKVESIDIDDDAQHIVIIVNAWAGQFIGRKGKLIKGLEEKIQEELGDDWSVKISATY